LTDAESEKRAEHDNLTLERDAQLEKMKAKKEELQSNLDSLLKIVESKRSEKTTKMELIKKKKDLLGDMQKKNEDLQHEKNQLNLN